MPAVRVIISEEVERLLTELGQRQTVPVKKATMAHSLLLAVLEHYAEHNDPIAWRGFLDEPEPLQVAKDESPPATPLKRKRGRPRKVRS